MALHLPAPPLPDCSAPSTTACAAGPCWAPTSRRCGACWAWSCWACSAVWKDCAVQPGSGLALHGCSCCSVFTAAAATLRCRLQGDKEIKLGSCPSCETKGPFSVRYCAVGPQWCNPARIAPDCMHHLRRHG